MALVTTFDELNEAQFKIYADGLMGNTRTHQKRKEFISYLHSVNAKDKKEIETERSSVILKLLELQKREKYISTLSVGHGFDYAKTDYLFTSDDLTDAELETLVTEENTTVYVHGKTYTGNIHITADYVTLDGQSNKKSAISEELANSASFVGGVTISADNCILKGIDFTSTGEKALTFGVGCENVTFKDCTFTAGDDADSKWWYGENLGGSVTITNCRVEGFKSWYLADFSSTSGVPQAATTKIRMKRCYFKNNLGSIASRGLSGSPTKLVQYSNNKFETDTIHGSFWDFCEINNALKVIVTDNEAIAPVGTETQPGKMGFFQSFSKEPKPWVLKYSGNKISNLKLGGKCALTNGFYSPNTSDEDDHKIDLSATLTNVFSFLYKKNDGTTASADKWTPAGQGQYTPVNISTFSSPPSIVNPSAYTVVTI